MWNGYYPDVFSRTGYPLRVSVVTSGAPEGEIVSLDAMRNFLNNPDTTFNDRITSLIVSARVHAEKHTRRSLVKKQYLMSLSRFPNLFLDQSQTINLWYPPLTGHVSIKYVDSNGASQPLISGKDFQVDFAGEPGRVAPLASGSWPQTQFGVLNAVQIFYNAGYEPNSTERPPADTLGNNITEPEIEAVDQPSASMVSTYMIDRTIPNDLVTAIMQLVTHWYQSRNPVITTAGAGGQHLVLPWHIEKIFDDYTFDTLTPTVTPDF